MGIITSSHKAVIKRHLDESLVEDVPLEQIHRELSEVFQEKGKYSVPQITAVTSWLRSSLLGDKRICPIDWDEAEDEPTNEDTNFDNPAKNESRAWQIANIVKHTSLEQRRSMYFSLLPGKNTYDFEALEEIGISCRNLLTFILGNDPKAVAQYIRNCRKFGVEDRVVGDISEKISGIRRPIQGLYWDYFGQACPAFIKNMWSIPLEPNAGPIPIGLNIMKGREHQLTTQQMQIAAELHRNQGKMEDLSSFWQHTLELSFGYEEPSQSVLADIRNETLQPAFFSKVGVANAKNWALEEDVRKLIEQFLVIGGDEKRYEELTELERYLEYDRVMLVVTTIATLIDQKLQKQKSNIVVPFAMLAANTSFALVNRPVLKAVEAPKEYISPEGNRLFVSYFGVIETKRNHYLKYTKAMKFFLDVIMYIFSEGANSTDFTIHPGRFSCNHAGSAKTINFFGENNKLIASVNYDFLIEATIELGISMISPLNGEILSQKETLAQVRRILSANSKHLEKFGPIQTIRNTEERVGRNNPCPCGSGHKYKKCCLRH